MAKKAGNGIGGSEAEREKVRWALAALKGFTRKPKGHERFCTWDEKDFKLRFKDGGARRMKSERAAREYAAKNGYELV